MQTQNRVTLAEPRLPREVVLQGLQVAKVNSGFLMAVSLRSKDNSVPSDVLNNIVAAQVLDPISRIPGVGQTQQFGAEYSMRIWLNPDKLRSFRISAAEVLERVRGQNVQFATGSLGEQPAVQGQQVVAPVSAEAQFSSKEEFENVILRTEPNGTSVRLKDVARVELGLNTYSFDVRLNDQPVAGFGVLLSPGANALEVAEAGQDAHGRTGAQLPRRRRVVPAVRRDDLHQRRHPRSGGHAGHRRGAGVHRDARVPAELPRHAHSRRSWCRWRSWARSSAWRSFGFSINQLTLFGMVLAIGIVVDDAIVVIESVERIMREEHLSPKEATRKAMTQITNPIIAISVVLAAVFIPSALQSGSVGMIYQQFAMTIAISMGFSAFLALSLTPALCGTLLRPEHLKENRFFKLFNHGYDQRAEILRSLGEVQPASPALLARGLPGAAACRRFSVHPRCPAASYPKKTRASPSAWCMMPPGTSQPRTREFMQSVSEQLRTNEAVDSVFEVTGFSFIGAR